MSRQTTRKEIQEAIHSLAAKGLIYDTGERRKGQIVWSVTPGKEAVMEPRRKSQSDE